MTAFRKKLFAPNLYEWYGVDILLNLDLGTYSLRIVGESGTLAANVEKQPFATGAGGKYSLKEYSFVGDLADKEPTDFYIDELSISTTNTVQLGEQVAPGRRKYFFEIWDAYHRELQGQFRCLPAINLEDFGIYGAEYAALTANRELGILQRLTRDTHDIGKSEDWAASTDLSAIVDWRRACRSLEKQEFAEAREHIDRALDKKPNAYIYLLTSLLVDAARSKDWEALYRRAYSLQTRGSDTRNQVAMAMISFHANRAMDVDRMRDAAAALARLDRMSAAEVDQLKTFGMEALNSNYVAQMRSMMPDTWERTLQWMIALEQHYYAALWQGNYAGARGIAQQASRKLSARRIEPGIWREREADCALLARDFETALDLYNALVPASLGAQLKMADAYHMMGDLTSEKSIRENIYRNFRK